MEKEKFEKYIYRYSNMAIYGIWCILNLMWLPLWLAVSIYV